MNEKPSTLLNRFVSRWDELQRIRKQQAGAVNDLREVTDEILQNPDLVKILKDTGVSVGAVYGSARAIHYNQELANTAEPLEVVEPPDMPYAFQVDDMLAPEPDVMGDAGDE